MRRTAANSNSYSNNNSRLPITTVLLLLLLTMMMAAGVLLRIQHSKQRFLPLANAFSTTVSTTSYRHRSFRLCSTASTSSNDNTNKVINLHTIPLEELEEIISSWGHPKYRAKQIQNWVRVQGVTNVQDMNNLPKTLRRDLEQFAAVGSLTLNTELISKDGTKKRAYQLADGQLIESVLMPYSDGRYTACISSQAGCAQGCVFCATGQMGFSRQLTPDEIFEQVARFASELAQIDKERTKEKKKLNPKQQLPGRSTRLSNIVFMGMGEPLANYKNVKKAVQRIQAELGIGHRKITISTVGIVPNIYKMAEDLPQVRLAVSLHCASDQERTDLLPANKRYGGLNELMQSLQDYISNTGKRITLEWALIEGENDTPETAHQLGKLVQKWLRRDMVHVNVIPLNPTGGYGGSPSGRNRVNDFIQILDEKYGVACTPRVRRGIDINAGCGQLTAEIEKRQQAERMDEESSSLTTATVEATGNEDDKPKKHSSFIVVEEEAQAFALDEAPVEMTEDDDWTDQVYEQKSGQMDEVNRLIDLVKGTTIDTFSVNAPATSTTSSESKEQQ